MITAKTLQDALVAFLDGEFAELTDALAETRLAAEGEPDYDADEYDAVDDVVTVVDANSFANEGVLTTDAGLVLYMSDGSQFQITIVRSR
jgi:hypothetical protein